MQTSGNGQVNGIMRVWVVMAKIEDIQASSSSIDSVFDSREKSIKYVLEHKDDNGGNIRGIDWNIEEWNVE
jgi:hypothetical protein